MATVIASGSARGRATRRWRRVRRRPWARPNGLLPAAAVFALIPSLPRATLAQLTHRLIDRMDEIDGDPDLEHLLEDDEDGADREEMPYA